MSANNVFAPKATSLLSLPASSGRPNEDFACCGDGFAVLLDGATGLSGRDALQHGYGSDARWFSHRLGSKLAAGLSQGKREVDEMLSACSDESASEWAELGGSLEDGLGIPSATLDIAIWGDGELRIWTIGDSPAISVFSDGTCDVPVSSGMDLLESENIEAIKAALEQTGGDVQAAREIAQPVLRATREKRNREDGYWVADITDKWQSHVEKRAYPLESVSCLLLASDGFSAAVSHGIASDLAKLALRCAYGEGHAMADALRAAEAADAGFTAVPRTKLHDDCSFVSIAF